MTTPQLIDQETGDTLTVDLASLDLSLPALLPSTPQVRGIDATNTRTRGPTTVVLDILATDMPGVGDARDVVEGRLQSWADNATRLQLVVPFVPVVGDLIVGTRGLSIGDSTTGRWSVVLQEVKEVEPSVGEVAFPLALDDLADELATNAEGGEQSGTEVERSLSLRALQSLGVAQ